MVIDWGLAEEKVYQLQRGQVVMVNESSEKVRAGTEAAVAYLWM